MFKKNRKLGVDTNLKLKDNGMIFTAIGENFKFKLKKIQRKNTCIKKMLYIKK